MKPATDLLFMKAPEGVLFARSGNSLSPNYAINPTPEQALCSNRAILPARVIAALDLMSTLTERDDFENAYFHFIEALRVLASPPDEACERLGYFNVTVEAKLDFENSQYLFKLPACTLTAAHKGSVDAIIQELNKIPDEVLGYTNYRDESLQNMSHPCWQKIREMAAILVAELQAFTEVNCWYMEQDRKNWGAKENEI